MGLNVYVLSVEATSKVAHVASNSAGSYHRGNNIVINLIASSVRCLTYTGFKNYILSHIVVLTFFCSYFTLLEYNV